MSTIVESNLESILPSNGPSTNEVKKYLDKTLIATYGDGLSNVNIKKFVRFKVGEGI